MSAGDAERLGARRALSTGDYLTAFDFVQSALEAGVADTELRYVGVLALARSGATAKACELYEEWALADQPANDALASDLLALRARLDKDLALASGDVDLAARSAAGYANVHERFGGSYPAVNAATLWRLAGMDTEADRWADIALGELGTTDSDYWQEATAAEAHLVRADVDA